MNTRQVTGRQDQKVNVKIVLSGLWVSMLFVFAYVDIFAYLRADVINGAICFYDAQVNDSRLVLNLARTAASLGAAVVTSTRAVGLLRDARQVTGVRVRDLESGEEFVDRASAVADRADRILSLHGDHFSGGGRRRAGLRALAENASR